MATFVKFNQFVEDVAHGVHDLETDQLVVFLTNTAPTVATDATITNITEISYTNLSTRNITTTSSAETAGVYKLTLTDLVLTASGAVPTFRYVGVYNDTPTTPADPLIQYYDYGSGVTMASGETFTIDFDATNGFLTIT